jgi:hypothetical protein
MKSAAPSPSPSFPGTEPFSLGKSSSLPSALPVGSVWKPVDLGKFSCIDAESQGSRPCRMSVQAIQEDINKDDGNGRASIATGSTISRNFSDHDNNPEQLQHLRVVAGAVRNVCLQATKTYLITHHANRQARGSHSDKDYIENPSKCGLNLNRHSQVNNIGGAASEMLNSSCLPPLTIPPISESLLKNISGICSMLWAGSQHDRLTVLNVERMTVDNMAKLLAWGETVALNAYNEWSLGNEGALCPVLDAGKSLCAWLGIEEVSRDMHELDIRLTRIEENAEL